MDAELIFWIILGIICVGFIFIAPRLGNTSDSVPMDTIRRIENGGRLL
jgi:hypothetical protein